VKFISESCKNNRRSLRGDIRVPGDKSISHRSIMLGAIAEGTTYINGFLEGEDALATLNSFKAMGVNIIGPYKGEVSVHGVGMNGLSSPKNPLYLGNSGTSVRLLAGLLSGQNFDTTLVGDDSLSIRPMGRVVDPLTLMGANISSKDGLLPLQIKGGDSLTGLNYHLPMASAQVKSAILLAGLYADGKTSITEPAPTRDHTERMLSGFGYTVEKNDSKISIFGGGKLRSCSIDVPADISSAAFFMVAASIVPGSDIVLRHVGINPTRTGVIDILKLMGADITVSNMKDVGGEPVGDIRIRYTQLNGIEIPVNLVPLAIDEFPVILVAASFAAGTTVLKGAEELRVKESDRIQAMVDGLNLIGVDIEGTADGAIVNGGLVNSQINEIEVNSFHDHRIAMAFAVAGLRVESKLVINDCDNVATSFPNFTDLANSIGFAIRKE
jgi:3-phosphoshikimate 1-carboxyvinyltransferase